MRESSGPDRAEGVVPVRKRGYYRALKRGAPWALELKGRVDYANEAINGFYYNRALAQKSWDEMQRLLRIRLGEP